MMVLTEYFKNCQHRVLTLPCCDVDWGKKVPEFIRRWSHTDL